MKHIISLLLENEAGALSRVAGLFSARAFNIESLSVAPTEDSTISRLTLVTTGSDAIVEQITKQLNKLVDVIKVVDLNEYEHIEKELLLTKLIAKEKAGIFKNNVLSISAPQEYNVEKVLSEEAKKVGAKILLYDKDWKLFKNSELNKIKYLEKSFYFSLQPLKIIPIDVFRLWVASRNLKTHFLTI